MLCRICYTYVIYYHYAGSGFLVIFNQPAEELADEELDSNDMLPLLMSIKYMKAQYVHKDDEASFFYEALRQGLTAFKRWNMIELNIM